MFCDNCGKENVNQTKFCISCGQKVDDLSYESVGTDVNQTIHSETEQQFNPIQVMERPVGTQVNHFKAQSQNQPRKPFARKKLVIAIVAAVILILGATLAFSRDSIFLAVAPKLYVSNTLESTFKNLTNQMEESRNSFSGVKIGENDSYTLPLLNCLNKC